MNALYNCGIHLYAGAARLAATRSSKVKKMILGQRETMPRLTQKIAQLGQGDWIWMHAASLGEFEQGRPLIEMIKSNHPEVKILLTFFSPSGYEVRRDYPLVDAVAYLPFDTRKNARQLVDTLKPRMALFIKYEFWGNYLCELQRAGVPIYLVSAIFRPKQIFFRPWGGMFRRMLRCFTKFYVQDTNSVHLLRKIGIKEVERTGDTRLDRVNDVMKLPPKATSLAKFAPDAQFRLIVGSSWEADEAIYIPWLNDHPEVAAVIAPHEFDADRLAKLKQAVNAPSMLLSEWEKAVEEDREGLDKTRLVIVDSFGKLSSIYRYGHAAYVGGGFGQGIHNINEAAVYGIPVVFGPKHAKFREARDLIELKAAFSAPNAEGIQGILDRLYEDPTLRERAGQAASDYISSHLGATSHIYRDIFE